MLSIPTLTSSLKAFSFGPNDGNIYVYDKLTLIQSSSKGYTSFVSGVYLRNNDLLLVHSDHEYLCLGTNIVTPAATYVAPSSQIKFIYS